MTSHLLGIDVGFSEKRPTTGIAWLIDGQAQVVKTHTDWARRSEKLPAISSFAVIAIDGPLLPRAAAERAVRDCERQLSRGPFQKRCKPGMSHFGFGLSLRVAARQTADQVAHLADRTGSTFVGPRVIEGVPIVEAFPNAFIGVLLGEEAYGGPPAAKRRKFDWLYDKAVRSGAFGSVAKHLGLGETGIADRLDKEHDHERRAALVCLLTAACAATGKFEIVGDEVGGYLWLPPRELWAVWARDALPAQADLRGAGQLSRPEPARP